MRAHRAAKLALALAGCVLAVGAAELGLRLWSPPAVRDLFDQRLHGTPGERVMTVDPTYDTHPRNNIYTQDEELGYRPVLGGKEYGPHGAQWNDYPLEKRPGMRRLLFLGDSVTQRGKVIDGLRELLGERVELWNAGVIGYASAQELEYYRRYLEGIRPDHVVLSFHLNDFETTPVTFLDGERFVAVYTGGSARPSPWLLRHSFLYRWLWIRRLRSTAGDRALEIEQEVRAALRGLRDLVQERGAEFTVLVLPWFLPFDRWSEVQRAHHEETVRTLDALGVRHFEFLDALARALAEGVEVQETRGDVQHPSAEFARRMAADLLARGFRP